MKPRDETLDAETANRLEKSLRSRIRRELLARRLLWLGTFGALGVVLALVRPLLSASGSTQTPEAGPRDR